MNSVSGAQRLIANAPCEVVAEHEQQDRRTRRRSSPAGSRAGGADGPAPVDGPRTIDGLPVASPSSAAIIGASVVRRLVGILFVSVLLALALTGTAFAGGGGGSVVQATDPSAGSPAGVVYSIPLDSARQDASPHGHGGSGAGGSGGGGGIGGGGGGRFRRRHDRWRHDRWRHRSRWRHDRWRHGCGSSGGGSAGGSGAAQRLIAPSTRRGEPLSSCPVDSPDRSSTHPTASVPPRKVPSLNAPAGRRPRRRSEQRELGAAAGGPARGRWCWCSAATSEFAPGARRGAPSSLRRRSPRSSRPAPLSRPRSAWTTARSTGRSGGSAPATSAVHPRRLLRRPWRSAIAAL